MLKGIRNTTFAVLFVCARVLYGQRAPDDMTEQAMQDRITNLEAEVSELKTLVGQLNASPTNRVSSQASEGSSPASQVDIGPPQQLLLTQDDRNNLDFLHDTTINIAVDGYYAYNFNHPVGRVNLLRAYDVLSNEFSLSQASVILEHAPDPTAGRRWGGRVDLQFGQATDTLQGNPSNEPRPDVYRNIFQAYGTYVAPIGKGVTIDFGKWSSSLGVEGNYTKDQFDYSRSYWFYFLPFYHMGLRTNIPITNSFSFNYWLVNGTNQVEATNGFKDELFGFTAKPKKNVTWTVNYYLGQEHPDRLVGESGIPVPVQPGLDFVAIRPAPDGRTHIFDSYVIWQANAKLTLGLEGDYFVQRVWRNSAPGESSAPAHTDGGAAYVRYELTPKVALATRAE